MDEQYKEFLNQLRNLEIALKSFSNKDADELAPSDDLRKEILKQQKSANKLQFDMGKLLGMLEESTSSFAGGSQNGSKASTDVSRFASEEVVRQFQEKAKNRLG